MNVAQLKQLVDTVVIVMMENRSFDHLLGFLSHEDYDGRTDVDGLHRPGPTFSWANPDDAGNLYPPTATADSYLACDLPHGRGEVAQQLDGMAMTGFIKAYFAAQAIDRSPSPMRFCRPEDIPVTAALARANTVCDRWFAPLPVDTQPNRLMAMSGLTRIDSTSVISVPTRLLPVQPTILDWLHSHEIPSAVYVDAQAVGNLLAPSNFLLMTSQWAYLSSSAYPLANLAHDWASAAAAPSVIYCEPFYNDFATALNTHGDCNHPPLPVAYGEAFLKKVYDALSSNPAKWKRTVLLVCYDEHGGFFDHVSPPAIGYSEPEGGEWQDSTPFASLGVRVPGLVISPLVEAGSCFHGLLDHTSILQLVVELFGAPGDLDPFGAASARKAQGIQSLSEALTRAVPRTNVCTLAAPAVPGGATSAPLSDLGRAYQLAIQMQNHGAQP